MSIDTFVGQVADHARETPEALALAHGTTSVSYSELWQRVLGASEFLREQGVAPGDRLLLAAPREPAFVCAYLGCQLLGAIAVPYEPEITPPALQNAIELVDPALVLTGSRTPLQMSDCRSLPLDALNVSTDLVHKNDFTEPDQNATADILLTSGTTGRRKGVMLSHRNILAAARNINQFIGNTREDREGIALPLNHSFGLGRLRCQLLAGGAVILTRGFQYPKEMFDAMRNGRATAFSFVPAAWAMLVRLMGERIVEFLPPLRYIEIGSATMPVAEKERLMRLFPNTRICMHYGLTEASRSAFIEFHHSNDHLDSIGRATPNVEILLVDEQGRNVEQGQVGKIRIGGEHVMQGYWGADSGERLQGNQLHSGDLGYCDKDNYLYLCGREDDVINVGGRKVHPAEVERALLAHQQIEDAACVAVPHVVTGETVCALLVPKKGYAQAPSAESLTQFLSARLEQYKIPLTFEWVESIPRNPSGKIERKAVRGLLDGAERAVAGAR
jgi:long-chain acyl-CoA synthetase